MPKAPVLHLREHADRPDGLEAAGVGIGPDRDHALSDRDLDHIEDVLPVEGAVERRWARESRRLSLNERSTAKVGL